MATARRRTVLLVLCGLVVVVALAALAIGVERANDPGKGIPRADAIQRAWQHMDPGGVAVASAELRHDFQTGFDLPTHSWAWVVTFTGQWRLLCSGHDPSGACDPTTEWVAIDYYTGDWIASQYSYPNRR